MFKNLSRKSVAVRLCTKILSIILILLLFTSYAYASSTDIVRELIHQHYLFTIPVESLNATTPKGMIDALGDPHSSYMTKAEYEGFINGINLDFVGIGAYVEKVPEGIILISIIEGSGAEEAGLLPGDIVIKAGDKDLFNVSLEEGIDAIRGPENTMILLSILRENMIFVVEVQRKRIHVPTVVGKVENGIGYIRINSFGSDTSNEFYSVYSQLESGSVHGYIIDVQNNPGGYLSSVVELLGYFIGDKTAVVTKDKENKASHYSASQSEPLIHKPVVVLMNEYSASASEIFAAAMKDYQRGLLLGNNSYGKGTVQNLWFLLPERDVVKLTVEQFFSPQGSTIHQIGVQPDIHTGEADAIKVARLLLGKPPAPYGYRGFLRLVEGQQTFYVSLSEARTPENWEAYNALLAWYKARGQNLYYGTFNGWQLMPATYWKDKAKLLFPDYAVLHKLEDVPVNKEFTITFSRAVDAATVSSGSVELIEDETGKRIPMNLIKISGNQYKAVPKVNLTTGKTYYLTMHRAIKDEKGLPLGRGTVVLVTVAE